MSQTLIEQISPHDWNSTPPSVQRILLFFQREMETIRERVERLEQTRAVPREVLERYHLLVDQQFSQGLTSEEQEEIEQLGKEIDAANVSAYPSLASLSDTIAAQTGKQPK